MKQNSGSKRLLIIASVLLVILMLASVSCAKGGSSKLVNGDFSKLGSDKLPVGWTFSSYSNNAANSTAVVISDASYGNVVRITNVAEDDAHLTQTVTVKPNTIYRFSVAVKTENVAGGAGANIGLEDLSCYSTPLLGTNDWRLIELVGRTGSNQNSLRIGCRLGNFGATSSGTAYFSEFKMKELSSYDGTVNSFAVSNTPANNSSSSNDSVKPEEYKARMTTAVFTICVFAIVPMVVGFLVWYEHAAEKRRGGEPIRTPAQKAPSFFSADASLPGKTDTKLHYTKLDWIFVCVLTAVYAVLAVTNLGSTKAPDSEWKAYAGTQAVLVFDEPVEIYDIWQDGGITGGSGNTGTTSYTLTGTDGNSVTADQRFLIMYRWNKLTIPTGSKPIKTDRITLHVTKGEAWINELAFFDANGNRLNVHAEDPVNAALVDEQDTVPDYPSYMTGMYFDELYHARTAYEHLNNMKVYEVSHPPLGKMIIALGVAIFGMNPFGWRIMGAIFGILMVPLMYAFGKRMFKRPGLALLAAALMTFDFMHYTQTRISTIDSYGVFFNLCMTYYMYKFMKMDLGDDFTATLKPLFLSGLFFGLGCSSKWICMYTGVALAVMFFAKMIMLGIKAHKINHAELTEEQKNEPAAINAKNYTSRLLKTILVCIPFFIILPAMIYLASYCRYYTAEWRPNAEKAKIAQMRATGAINPGDPDPENVLNLGEKASAYVNGVIKNQKYMFSYHSGLTSRHAYESAWYEWPLSNRPMWFYAGYNHPDKSVYGTISSFGNPAVWWVCFAGTLFLVFLTLRGRFKLNTEVFFILCCMGSSMLPWMIISRSVFIYHYFATVPMIILASVYVFKHYEDKFWYVPKELGMELPKSRKLVPAAKYIWIAAAIILFAVFYPVLTGIPVKKTYIEALEWLPTWEFMGYWPSIWPN